MEHLAKIQVERTRMQYFFDFIWNEHNKSIYIIYLVELHQLENID